MKITTEDYQALERALLRVLAAHPDARAEYIAAGYSDMRYNWDMLRASKFDTCALYRYLDDKHIGSALAKILENTGFNKDGKR